jgi:hypothetical protein
VANRRLPSKIAQRILSLRKELGGISGTGVDIVRDTRVVRRTVEKIIQRQWLRDIEFTVAEQPLQIQTIRVPIPLLPRELVVDVLSIARCALIPDNLPKFAILIRLGNFRVDLVGRMQIAVAATLIAMLLGIRLFVL